ncbi:MAG: SAM-dependent methyltransferase, partial [Chloroflexi bacterium]|nr:SAM-dependent methyltransferase [Chloroflexota bacterium]
MPVDVEQLRRHLQAFDLPRLLVEDLGWNRYPARPVSVQVEGSTYTLEPAAEKKGFAVYVCGPGPDGLVPPYPVRRKIERQAAKVAYEHMIIFADGPRTMQVWQWVKREGGKPAACREQEYRKGQRGDALVQRLQRLAFELEEEERLSIPLVALRVQQALDAEKVTKRFYERFKKELETFRSFIQGIAVQGDREWYASLMLNRMMFVYFIQKQGFLDGDPNYLRNRLKRVQERTGKGRFQQFYRLFLLRLFHEGLGQPEAMRAPELAVLLGRVPYLNGGLFDVHDLERDNPDIQIPDEAFETIFDFFDGYRWHLDERPHRADNEINPDVLGYIFEKYINQKQMGAYYTKEDITGYIARNTVVPFLFDAARKECPVAFAPEGGVWRLLKDDPDRYVYPAVGHGVTWDAHQQPPTRLERPCDLPEEIAAGIGDVSKRGDWNRPAPEEYALPTETWREVVARRKRHQEVRAKLAAGEVHEINDLITLNLDVCQFAEDVIVQSEGPELVRAFWHALRDASILDPTCGSGAFLFAALNILEPLY